jgi:hypothetical protein
MISFVKARQIALALPGTTEEDHRGRPSFRVRKKIYTTLWLNERKAVVKATLIDQAALIEWHPTIFSAVPGWGRQGWTFVDLDEVPRKMFNDVLVAAWRGVAPKPLVASYDTRPGANPT